MKFKNRRFLSKILSPTLAKKKCQSLHKKNIKVVFTNGCFDILHVGHVSYLEKAREKGDFLVVALDTDKAVKKLKGPTRPVNDLKSRMQVLAALECVDLVTWFEGGNPIPVIEKLKPNVLVKGGDWKIPKILGSKEVLAWGGKVFSIKFIVGKSTTSLIQKIRSL